MSHDITDDIFDTEYRFFYQFNHYYDGAYEEYNFIRWIADSDVDEK